MTAPEIPSIDLEAQIARQQRYVAESTLPSTIAEESAILSSLKRLRRVELAAREAVFALEEGTDYTDRHSEEHFRGIADALGDALEGCHHD